MLTNSLTILVTGCGKSLENDSKVDQSLTCAKARKPRGQWSETLKEQMISFVFRNLLRRAPYWAALLSNSPIMSLTRGTHSTQTCQINSWGLVPSSRTLAGDIYLPVASSPSTPRLLADLKSKPFAWPRLGEISSKTLKEELCNTQTPKPNSL